MSSPRIGLRLASLALPVYFAWERLRAPAWVLARWEMRHTGRQRRAAKEDNTCVP